MVSIILNLAFVPEYVTERFSFEQGFIKKFKPAIQEFRKTHPVKESGYVPKSKVTKDETANSKSALMNKLTKKFQ